jgi:hypothetical protein
MYVCVTCNFCCFSNNYIRICTHTYIHVFLFCISVDMGLCTLITSVSLHFLIFLSDRSAFYEILESVNKW